jgi:hypothetical protein
MMLTTSLHLVSESRICGTLTQCPLCLHGKCLGIGENFNLPLLFIFAFLWFLRVLGNVVVLLHRNQSASSVWLTAFVAQVLQEASFYEWENFIYIDPEVMWIRVVPAVQVGKI